MAKREFLQLAHKYDPNRNHITGWYMSEKADGLRCFWDGGISRGMACEAVPYANHAKHARYIFKPIATGLWTRYGQPIQAPEWFINLLPSFPLDGELWLGRGTSVQDVSKIVKNLSPDSRWKEVGYHIFDLPSYKKVFANGKIDNTNFKKTLAGILTFVETFAKPDSLGFKTCPFETSLILLAKEVNQTENLRIHPQIRLPFQTSEAHRQLNEFLNSIVETGGEGVVLRNPIFAWEPERSHNILKVKPWDDAEGTVVGYTWGKETDKGSKLLGLMGALVLETNLSGINRRFELSGFTDEERSLIYSDTGLSAFREGARYPGEEVNSGITSARFPRGSRVTFKYRGLTNEGIPKEARYFRKTEEEG